MNNFHLREGKVEFRWKRWRNKKRQEVSSCLMVLFSGMVLLGGGGIALAGPTGGQITGGTGTISQSGPTTNINQTSNVLTINWQDFSIGASETVNFLQPGSTSIAVNMVTSGIPSQLAGALNANGRVFIMNSAGVTFTGTSHVNVGALLATTAMTINGDPSNAASYSGSGYGAVVNQGQITISDGGFAILAAPYVQNTGFIKADLGTVALAGTNQFTLDLSGTGLINFVVPAGTVQQIVSNGQALGVDNEGTLQARSGQVIISANVASQVINAAVNLNGVVDADAFAPNGKGGSVLVTGAGDINVGGQVTARGDGTGAGGQIVTKAGSADTIEALAYVSAVGGAAGGQGGLIEVSGKHVGLAGSIDPGRGGSLYIDPLQFTIFNGTSGISASGIGEHRLEHLLQSGVNFTVAASGNVIIQDLSDNQLTGGAGALSLTAGLAGTGNIVVQGTNDRIRTTTGNVTLTAAGDIGDSSHRLTFLSGGPGISQAGDIVLHTTSGGDIFVNNVVVRSSGHGQASALFSANAAGSFDAAGTIDVEAHANGIGSQAADAEIHVNAGNNIELHNLFDIASARENGGGGSVFANALVTLVAGNRISQSGNMVVAASVAGHSGSSFVAVADLVVDDASSVAFTGGAINVSAEANVFSANNVIANAHAEFSYDSRVSLDSIAVDAIAHGDKVGYLQANADFSIYAYALSIDGNAAVEASADNANLGRSASATAHMVLTALDGNASVHGDVTVNALALNGGASKDADASANLAITACGIEINGDVTVTANAQTLKLASGDSSTPSANASAVFHAIHGNIFIGGNIHVEALTSSLNTDSARANARASLYANSGNIEVDGSATVIANVVTNAQTVFDPQNIHGASASASLAIFAEGHIQLGDVTVKASAEDFGRYQANAVANLSVVASCNFAASISILGNVDVEANAQDPLGNGAYANARANIAGWYGVEIGFAGSSSVELGVNSAIEGDVTVKANALNGGSGNASALAGLSMNTKTSPVGVVGNVAVIASANDAGGGNALASAVADIAGAGSFETPGVEIGASTIEGGTIGGNVQVTADAVDAGGSAANAVAGLTLDPIFGPGFIHVWGGINVTADATNSGANASQAAASANAALTFAGASRIEVDGPMTVTAHGTNFGLGRVNAQGAIDFGGAGSLDLADVTIDVKALNLGNGNGGAKANASFSAGAGTSLHINSLNLQAQASSHGGSNATAHASANIAQQSLDIAGNVTVNAVALSEDGPGNAIADANLFLTATSGNITVGGHVDANAQAHDIGTGGGNAQANAIANLQAGADGTASIDIGSAHVTANAVDSGGGAAQAAAHLTLGASTIHISGDVDVKANASNLGGNPTKVAASADAELKFSSASSVSVGGAMSIVAHATNYGAGQVKAKGSVDFGGASDITLGDVTIDVKALNVGTGANKGSGGAKANASISASTGITFHLDSLNLQAQASSHGGANATAHASGNIAQKGSLSISGAVTVNAVALSEGGAGNAIAAANLFLTATSGNLTVGGDVDVSAQAHDIGAGGGNAQANAIASLTASGGSLANISIGGAHVIANAVDSGGGVAAALAELTFDPGLVQISSDVDVKAFATNLGGNPGEVAASANAQLVFSSASTVRVEGAMSIVAHGTNYGPGKVLGQGGVDFGGATSIDLADVTIDVKALNLGTGANKGSGGAKANAILSASAGITFHLDSLNLQAQASSHGGANATAHASGNINQPGSLSISGAVTVNAVALSVGGPGNAIADADLFLKASSGNLTVGGDVNVSAQAHDTGAGGGNAQANAIASLTASDEGSANISIGSAHVIANAVDSGAGVAQANAHLTLDASSSIHILGEADVKAYATNFGGNPGKVAASANAQLDFTGASTVTVDSAMSIVAHATNHGQGKVLAKGGVDFGSATSIDLASVTIDVKALNLGTGASAGSGGAKALANFIETNPANHVHLSALNLQAQASSHGGEGASATATGQITQASLSIAGDVIVNAQAFNNGAGGSAKAKAELELTASTDALFIGGNVEVNANAQATDPANVIATAFVNLSAAGEAHVEGNIDVSASASSNAVSGTTGSVRANAQLHMHGQGGVRLGTASGSPSDLHFFNGDVSVTANELSNRAHRGAAIAIASIQAGSSEGGSPVDLLMAGNFHVEADAGGGSGGANVFAIASLNAFARRDIAIEGGIQVLANADDHGNRIAFADAFASLDAQSGSVFVNGEAKVEADLRGNGLRFGSVCSDTIGLDGYSAHAGFADAELNVMAGDGNASLDSIAVTANTLLTNPGHASSPNESASPSGGAYAGLDITANFGDVTIHGPVRVNAAAQASASNLFLRATASGSIHAGEGNITILGPVAFRANAQELNSESAAAGAVSNVEMRAAGNIVLPGIASRALAGTRASGSGGAGAFANLALIASHDVDIFHSGAFAGASANGSQAPLPAGGIAHLLIAAGHDVNIKGNVVAAAVGLGGGTGDIAIGIVDIEAGALGSGDLNMSGDIAALTFADPKNDFAVAGVVVNVHNDINIFGHDPIASAHAGTAAAFLQTHITDARIDFGGSGSTALGFVIIRAGGKTTFINPDDANRANDLALFALPAQDPTLAPTRLTEIQLLIDGQDCGALGSAGADKAKAAACAKSGLNTDGVTDALP